MRLSCLQEKLSRGLNLAGRLVGSKTTLPVLNNILLEAKQGKLIITSTDLEIAIKTLIGAIVEEEGKITIPARLLADFVAANGDKKIKIKSDNKNLTIKSKHSLAHIRGIDASEFPLIPKIKEGVSISLSSTDLLSGLSKVVIAAASDDSRPTLAGVYFKKTDLKLKLVATDSYRLAEKTIILEKNEAQDFSFILPLRTAQELIRILSILEPGNISLKFNENQIVFNGQGVELISRLVEGDFPDYEQIIPQNYKTKVKLSSKNFVSTIKMVNLFAEDSANSIGLNFDKNGEVMVEATSNQIGDNKSTLKGVIEGENNKIAFNARFIIDGLNILGGDEDVNFEMTGSLNPGIIRSNRDKNYLYVVMPLKTDNG